MEHEISDKIVTQTKSEQAYLILREAIELGEYRPGEKLIISRLASRLGVSEIPIREACKRLEVEGFVKSKPYEGITVTEIDVDMVAETIEFRAILERESAKLTVPLLTPEAREELARKMEELRTVYESRNANGFSKANREFHVLLLKRCPNRALRDAALQVWNNLERARCGFRLIPEQMDAYFLLTQGVFQAIQDGDGDEAGQLLYQQSTSFGEKLGEHLRKSKQQGKVS